MDDIRVTLFQTGTPLNVNAGNDNLGFGGDTTNHANLVAPITYPKTFKQWFSTSSFAQPAPLKWGNAPRNAIEGPGRQNWNLSLYKTFRFTETTGLEFRADSFNTWNHTQLTGVDTGLFSGTFGQVNGTAGPRTFQCGAKAFCFICIGSLITTLLCVKPGASGFWLFVSAKVHARKECNCRPND